MALEADSPEVSGIVDFHPELIVLVEACVSFSASQAGASAALLSASVIATFNSLRVLLVYVKEGKGRWMDEDQRE